MRTTRKGYRFLSPVSPPPRGRVARAAGRGRWSADPGLGIYSAQRDRGGVSPALVHPGDGDLLARLVREQRGAEVVDVGGRGSAGRGGDRVPGSAPARGGRRP